MRQSQFNGAMTDWPGAGNTLLYDLSSYSPSANAWTSIPAAGAAPAFGIMNMGFASAGGKLYLFGGYADGLRTAPPSPAALAPVMLPVVTEWQAPRLSRE